MDPIRCQRDVGDDLYGYRAPIPSSKNRFGASFIFFDEMKERVFWKEEEEEGMGFIFTDTDRDKKTITSQYQVWIYTRNERLT